jgi:hypothetical protein
VINKVSFRKNDAYSVGLMAQPLKVYFSRIKMKILMMIVGYHILG